MVNTVHRDIKYMYIMQKRQVTAKTMMHVNTN